MWASRHQCGKDERVHDATIAIIYGITAGDWITVNGTRIAVGGHMNAITRFTVVCALVVPVVQGATLPSAFATTPTPSKLRAPVRITASYNDDEAIPSNAIAIPVWVSGYFDSNAVFSSALRRQPGEADQTLGYRAAERAETGSTSGYLVGNPAQRIGPATVVSYFAWDQAPSVVYENELKVRFAPPAALPTTVGRAINIRGSAFDIELSPESEAYAPLTRLTIESAAGEQLAETVTYQREGYGLKRGTVDNQRLFRVYAQSAKYDDRPLDGVRLGADARTTARECGERKTGTIELDVVVKTHIAGAPIDPAPLAVRIAYDCATPSFGRGEPEIYDYQTCGCSSAPQNRKTMLARGAEFLAFAAIVGAVRRRFARGRVAPASSTLPLA
jgi:hypothetical protein